VRVEASDLLCGKNSKITPEVMTYLPDANAKQPSFSVVAATLRHLNLSRRILFAFKSKATASLPHIARRQLFIE